MNESEKDLEIRELKKDLAKLRLEANMRKSLSQQLTIQKKVADESKAEALSKSKELEEVSSQLSRYLSPQIHEQIFSGKQSGEVKSYRKKLTIFFSDIVGFTSISDELESEELTNLLNFYLNEMSHIVLRHGGTIDKYIGDAVMVFFGDPETDGPEADAKKCVEMAIQMQKRMLELDGYWGKHFGLREPLQIRVGINTGFCTVGNFGSQERIDYTAIGRAVNLASRLEHLSSSGSINVSEETYMLVKAYFKFQGVREAEVKGFSRKIKFFPLNVIASENLNMVNLEGKGFEVKINKEILTHEELDKLQKSINSLKLDF
ncbi:MAG: adenylate/guanylate cyclase domain-containing protein [Pseudomonadota bacterium]|nr:adenylate/guanylate cyclase domain-containing protein [Pseudomonadota bacterium]